MGFFERLTKSVRGKNGSEVVTSEANRFYVRPPKFPQPHPLGIVPVSANGHERRRESNAVSAAAAVAKVAKSDQLPEPKPAAVSQPSGAPLFDADLDEHLSDAFKSLVEHDGSRATASDEEFSEDREAAEHLFADIAANYARPINNFILELKRGTATKEWIEICRPAMRGITRATQAIGLSLAAKHMVDFEAALSLAQKSDTHVLAGELRDLLLWCYQDLVRVMPQAFVVSEDDQQREGIIINSLLRQIPDVGRVTIEKLYRAGLTSLNTLYLAKPNELAATAAIPLQLGERICTKFQDYRAGISGKTEPDSDPRARLTRMLAELRRLQKCFQNASEKEEHNSTHSSEKREYRQQRQGCVFGINVLLAEMGELDLVNELERLSQGRRIQRLEEYLARAPATPQA